MTSFVKPSEFFVERLGPDEFSVTLGGATTIASGGDLEDFLFEINEALDSNVAEAGCSE